MEDSAFQHPLGKTTWVIPIPAASPLGGVIDERTGLSAAIRDGLTMDKAKPGLPFDYVLSHGADIETLLSPKQFEEAPHMCWQNAIRHGTQ